MSCDILYRAAHYSYDGNFQEFSYWGINHPNNGTNSSPAMMSGTKIKEHEQFVGRLGKNGKKIFKGDIVMCFDGYKRVVEWCLEEAGFKCMNIDDANFCEAIYLSDGEFEVIGNIHEGME